jgi:hypothetical protein
LAAILAARNFRIVSCSLKIKLIFRSDAVRGASELPKRLSGGRLSSGGGWIDDGLGAINP